VARRGRVLPEVRERERAQRRPRGSARKKGAREREEAERRSMRERSLPFAPRVRKTRERERCGPPPLPPPPTHPAPDAGFSTAPWTSRPCTRGGTRGLWRPASPRRGRRRTRPWTGRGRRSGCVPCSPPCPRTRRRAARAGRRPGCTDDRGRGGLCVFLRQGSGVGASNERTTRPLSLCCSNAPPPAPSTPRPSTRATSGCRPRASARPVRAGGELPEEQNISDGPAPAHFRGARCCSQ
jgi:hypothetical protein